LGARSRCQTAPAAPPRRQPSSAGCVRGSIDVHDSPSESWISAGAQQPPAKKPARASGGHAGRRSLPRRAAPRVSSSPAAVVRSFQKPERPVRAPPPAAALGAWRPARPHPAAPRCAGAAGRAAHWRSRAQLPASRRAVQPAGGIYTRRTDDVVTEPADSAPLRPPFGARLRRARPDISDHWNACGIGLRCPSAGEKVA